MTLAELIEKRKLLSVDEGNAIQEWAAKALKTLRTAYAALPDGCDALDAVDEVLRATEEEV